LYGIQVMGKPWLSLESRLTIVSLGALAATFAYLSASFKLWSLQKKAKTFVVLIKAAVPTKLLDRFLKVVNDEYLLLVTSAGATDCQVLTNVASMLNADSVSDDEVEEVISVSDDKVEEVIIVYEFDRQAAYRQAVSTAVAFNGANKQKVPLGILVGLDKLFPTEKTGIRYRCVTGDAARLTGEM